MPPPTTAAIEELTRRSEAIWVGLPGETPRLVWHVWHDGAAYLVGCPHEEALEQLLPVTGGSAEVVVRSRVRPTDQALTWAAQVSVVDPGTPRWVEVTPLLAAARLNVADVQDLPARWVTAGCVVLELRPDASAAELAAKQRRPRPAV